MELEEQLLPIGSVITSKAIKPELRKSTYLVITGRFFIHDKEKKTYFDYECNYYPGGTLDGTKLYINHDFVDQVIHKGYQDELDILFLEKYTKLITDNELTKAEQKKGKLSKTKEELR